MKGMERESKQNRKRKAGFTLIELLVVITILGILMAVAVKNVWQYVGESRITATYASIKAIDEAVQMFLMKHNDKLPDSLDELTQGDPPLLRDNALTDAWGTPFQYTKQGRKDWLITSAGVDGEFGTEDDLKNKNN